MTRKSVLISLCLLLVLAESFLVSPNSKAFPTRLHLSDTTTRTEQQLLSLSLPKPLGLILEEVEEGQPNGVYIQQVNERGSAFVYADKIEGCQLTSVQGVDATRLAFDDVMQLIVDAPETVDLQITTQGEDSSSAIKGPVSTFDVGTPVTITFQQPGSAVLEMKAKVGDNLRKTLRDNGVEVYQGLKQKLGNCGGGGTCTFCAVDILESKGWAERSDYEDNKLARFPNARLACLNNIHGPATIQKTQR